MLFNVLIDKIASCSFPQGTQVLIYADDKVLQCPTPRILQLALSQLAALCVINECKTKFQAKEKVSWLPTVNNVPIPRVHIQKYPDVQMSFRKSLQTIHYVQDLCLPQLAPLRLLANRGLEAGIPVLIMFYISVIRSLIDYAAPVLIQFSATQLRQLELVRNEAMRIILAIHVYCDGSVNGSRSECGLFIRDYISTNLYTDTEVSRRFPAHMSSTRAELYAVLEALHIVAPLHENVYFFIDSQAVLYVLQIHLPHGL
ncbi:hypothetical protein E2C01_088701 [Portunus trituberculatus]|uniref:Uncharacterized protein n=1 Tax=Portunus trituberculatus TaxID=210409 RepID=A0A5B7JK43_PORTR|nr:hypothetical protein [Portunus trituberculatus]